MNKRLLLFILTITLFCCFPSNSFAFYITNNTAFTPPFAVVFTPSVPDMDDFNHDYAYTWAINWNPPAGQTVTEATLMIDNINNWDNLDNNLYIHLLNAASFNANNPTDIKTYWDASNNTDFYAPDLPGQSIHLDTYVDSNGGPNGIIEDYIYHFSTDELAALNTYLADGLFSIGFDPDCHYWNDGVSLTVRTNPVPEPATMFLFTSGILAAFGRAKLKKRSA